MHCKIRRLINGFLAAAAGLVLTASLVACGGGGGDATTPPVANPVPGDGAGATAAPVIVSQPVSIEVAVGAPASFTVVASGSGSLSYQWSRNSVAIAGATTGTYALPTSAMTDSGVSFTVAVTNAGGSVVSAAAVLTVVAAPAQSVAQRLAAEPGPRLTTVLPFDGTYSGRSLSTGDLTLFETANGNVPIVVAAAGTWYPQATLLQAEIDVNAKTLRNLRERYRLYLKSGQLMRLDLAAGGATTPVRTSSLQLSDLCLGPDTPFGETFDDWTDPDASVLVYQSKPNCENPILELTQRRYIAVKAGMTAAQAPIDLGSQRPLAALRNEAGSLTGFVVYDGVSLNRVDANFSNAKVIAATLDDPRDVTVAVVGVFGPTADPYLLYHYRNVSSSTYQLYAYRLNGNAAPKLVYDTVAVYASTSDSTGTYLVAKTSDKLEARLFRLNDDFSLDSLIDQLPVSSSATITLTPSRYVVGTSTALTSMPRSGPGAREVFSTSQEIIDVVHAVGDDLYLALRGDTSGTLYDSHVKVMASDFTLGIDLAHTLLLAPMYDEVQPLTRRTYAFSPQAHMVMAESSDPDPSAYFKLSQATLSRYGAGRIRAVMGSIPDLNNTGDAPALVSEANGAAPYGLPEWRYYSAYQFGQPGVVTGFGSDSCLAPSRGGAIVKLTSYF